MYIGRIYRKKNETTLISSCIILKYISMYYVYILSAKVKFI